MYIDGDMIVVSIRAHQYKLALRRQVLRTEYLFLYCCARFLVPPSLGGTKNRAQQYKLALRQMVIKFNML